jgi:hypothetical protein
VGRPGLRDRSGRRPGARHVVLDGQTLAVAHDVIAPVVIDHFRP